MPGPVQQVVGKLGQPAGVEQGQPPLAEEPSIGEEVPGDPVEDRHRPAGSVRLQVVAQRQECGPLIRAKAGLQVLAPLGLEARLGLVQQNL